MKHKPTLFDTPFVKTYNMKSMLSGAVKFLKTNQSLTDLDTSGYLSLLRNTNPMTSSHINSLYSRMIAEGKLEEMYIFSYSENPATNIPELLTIEDVLVDGKYTGISVPANLEKVWMNLTPCLAPRGRNRREGVQVADVPKLVSLTTRGFLCSSYNDSSEWLTTPTQLFLIEFYAVTINTVLTRAFSLDFNEQQLVTFLFAWYYSTLFGVRNDNPDRPVLLNKSKLILRGVTANNIEDEVFDKANEIRDGRDMSIGVVVDMLKSLGPARMAKLDERSLRRFVAMGSANPASMLIALDYPPYMLHQILQVAAGNKHPVMSNVLNNKFRRQDVFKILDGFLKDRSLYSRRK